MPKSSVATRCRYWPYACQIDWWPPPSSAWYVRMIPGFDWICAGLRCWRMPPIGSPGISLGRGT